MNEDYSKQKWAQYDKLGNNLGHLLTGPCNMVERQYLPCDNMALAMVGSALSDTTLVKMSTENGGVQSKHKAER